MADIDQMRRDFSRITAFRIDGGEWVWPEVDEFSQAIKAALEAGDPVVIDQWAGWCAKTAGSYYGPVPKVVRPANTKGGA